MKILRTHRNKLIVSFTILLLFSFCISPRGSTLLALSVYDEEVMGRKFLVGVRHHFDLVEDDFANQYINALGQYLIKPVEPKHFFFHFYIIKLQDVNAFAAPGGHIFFYSGLIQAMDEIDELAAVICHEIGHVAARHISQRIERHSKIGLAQLAGVLAGA
jgi:predicted Zn-dependent protease